MPQGVVVSIRPRTGVDSDLENDCTGVVKATEDDARMGIEKGKEYDFGRGSGSCCHKQPGDEVTIASKLPDGSVIIRCD